MRTEDYKDVEKVTAYTLKRARTMGFAISELEPDPRISAPAFDRSRPFVSKAFRCRIVSGEKIARLAIWGAREWLESIKILDDFIPVMTAENPLSRFYLLGQIVLVLEVVAGWGSIDEVDTFLKEIVP